MPPAPESWHLLLCPVYTVQSIEPKYSIASELHLQPRTSIKIRSILFCFKAMPRGLVRHLLGGTSASFWSISLYMFTVQIYVLHQRKVDAKVSQTPPNSLASSYLWLKPSFSAAGQMATISGSPTLSSQALGSELPTRRESPSSPQG